MQRIEFPFVQDLHRRMLGDVWQWAGKFRTSERNLGIAFYESPMALRQLLDDSKVMHDVTSGRNGACGGSYLCTAKTGYDGPTGNGTPKGTGAF
jgi:hypothetical protein